MQRKNLILIKKDDFIKSRHSGENRSLENFQLFEKTGFRLPAFAGTSFAGMTENRIFRLLMNSSKNMVYFSLPMVDYFPLAGIRQDGYRLGQ
jgi:hypothetical protein